MKSLAQKSRTDIVVSWDNFDYGETVRHQTLREQAKHISATTGKLCIGHYMPSGGLKDSMFHPDVPLTVDDVYDSPGNRFDNISIQCQRYWIAEAIRYVHKGAVDSIFNTLSSSHHSQPVEYPQFPSVERLNPRKTPHFGLGPILENEGTLRGTISVIDKIFQPQLGLQAPADFAGNIYLVYGDQKTVSLINSVKRDRKDSRNTYGRYGWLLPIPGLFHWRMNFIDMIYDLYSGPDTGWAPLSTLRHNRLFMCYVQGHKTPFHHKEELAMRSFEARIMAMFYNRIRPSCRCNDRSEVDRYIAKLSPSTFVDHVEAIRETVFKTEPAPESELDEELDEEEEKAGAGAESQTTSTVDQEFIAHCRFIQQMETYLSLKYAIKYADIGIIERIFARSCLLFHGSKKRNYAHLSLYMTWLTHTAAASPELRTALLANGLVNLRGAKDGWFEMDRLNEFFNLQMKNLMIARRSSSQSPDQLFRQVALTSNYSTQLRSSWEDAFGKYSNGRHQMKDASEDVYRLAYELHAKNSVRQFVRGRETEFMPRDTVNLSVGNILYNNIEKFNEAQLVVDDTDDLHASLADMLDVFSDNDSD